MSTLQRHTGTFAYRGKSIPFIYWSNLDGDTPPDTLVFMGAGQIDKSPYWTAGFAGAGVVVAEAAPHWYVRDIKDWDVREFCVGYQRNVLNDVLRRFKLHSLHLVSESQGASINIALAKETPEKIRSMVLIRPLGFTTAAYGKTKEDRLKVFKKRALANHLQWQQSPLHDWRNIQLKIDLLRVVLRESNWRFINQKYADGVSYDALPECREVAEIMHRQHKPFVILLAQNDKLFPPDEVLAAIKHAGIKHIKTEIIPHASHSSLAQIASKPILQHALATARSDKIYS